MYVYAPFVCCRGQKKELDPLELKLKMIVSHYFYAGNQTQGLCKSNKHSWPLSYHFIPSYLFLCKVSHWDLEHMNSASLVVQWNLSILPSLLPWFWDSKYVPPCPAVYIGARNWKQVLMLTQ